MKTPLAWRNVFQNKVRSFVALCGISFAILLIFMQLGFYAAARNSATLVFDALDFDILVVSPQYIFLARPAQFSRARLEQMRAVEGVESVVPLWLTVGEWRNPVTREPWNMLALGVEPDSRPFRDASINAQLPLLMEPDNALIDKRSRPQHGELGPGVESEMQGRRLRIVGQYAIGAGFVAGATTITSRETYFRLFAGTSADLPNLGLVRIAPGASPKRVAAAMNAQLWPVAAARPRAEIGGAEQSFWLNVKPIGIMFTSGVLVAFVAGAVILYQVLASEVHNRLKEYATLKALGYGNAYVYGIVLRQALIFAVFGFIPAFVCSLGLYFLLRTRGMMPVTMELTRVTGVFFLTTLMCVSATFLAIRKLRAADPADLF